MAQRGESVVVIAAQSIGEPGTQLTLRTFHVGGTASNIASDSKIIARYDGRLEIDELRIVAKQLDDKTVDMVIGRLAEMRIVDNNTGIALYAPTIPSGVTPYYKNGSEVSKSRLIC